MNRLRIVLASCCVVIVCALACSAQATKSSLILSSQDMAAAEWGLGHYSGNGGNIAWLQHEYCEARLPVVAKAVEQSPVLAENKKTVFTVSRFKVEKTLRSGAPMKPGSEIAVVEWGGTITDEHGVKLQVEYWNGAPFAIGHSYLLFLYQAPFRHSKVYLPHLERTEIVDGHLSKVGPAYTSFDDTALKQGESFDEFWKKMQLYLDHYPCYASTVPAAPSMAFFSALP